MANVIPLNQQQLCFCHLCFELVEGASISNDVPPLNAEIVHIMNVWASSTIIIESAVDKSSVRSVRCGRCESLIKKLLTLLIDADKTNKEFVEMSKSLAILHANAINRQRNARPGNLPTRDFNLLPVLIGQLKQMNEEIEGIQIQVEDIVVPAISRYACKNNWSPPNITPEENQLLVRIQEAWDARQPEVVVMEETVSPLISQPGTGETQASETAQASPAPLTSSPIPSTSRGVTRKNGLKKPSTTISMQPPPVTVDESHSPASTSSSVSSTVSTIIPAPGSSSGTCIAGSVRGSEDDYSYIDNEEVVQSTQATSLNNGEEPITNPEPRSSTEASTDLESTEIMDQQDTSSSTLPAANVDAQKRKRRGRPPGSKNVRKETVSKDVVTNKKAKKN